MAKFKVIVDNELKDLIPSYLQNRKNDIEKLKVHVEQKEIEDIRMIAHRIVGNAGGYGFNELGDWASVMEGLAKDENDGENLSKIEKTLNEMIFYLNNLEIDYR